MDSIEPAALPAGFFVDGQRAAYSAAMDRTAGFDPGVFVQSLEQIYGTQSGRGLALRIGRVVFQKFIKQYGRSYGFCSMEFRLQPAPARLENGIRRLAQVFNEHGKGEVQVIGQETHWEWQSNCSVFRGSRTTSDPSCYLMVGILQELMAWAGGGRFYRVTESACCSAGDATCIFRIDKKPID